MTFAVRKRALAPLLFAPLILATPAWAQRVLAPDAGCALQRGEYVCHWSALQLAWDRAHTVAVQAGPMDRSTLRQLRTLVGTLGKAETTAGQPADLTLMVLPVEPTGISFGPGDHDLATLRVYAPSAGSDRGVLLWVETLRGQGDRPWPAQVHVLIQQFEQRFRHG